MLNKTVYEFLPIFYLLFGICLFAVLESFYGFFSGLIFYFIGTLTWIARSKYRRKDKEKRRVHGIFPSMLYEELPFIYIGAGILFIIYLESISFWPSAILLIVAGLQILIMRSSHRRMNRVVLKRKAPRKQKVTYK